MWPASQSRLGKLDDDTSNIYHDFECPIINQQVAVVTHRSLDVLSINTQRPINVPVLGTFRVLTYSGVKI